MHSTGYNTGKAVSAIFEGIMSIVRAKTFGGVANDLGYIGGGLFGGIWGATVDAQEEAKMSDYKMAKGLQQTQDYLACVMEAQVSGAVYQLNERMDNDRITAFNNAIQGIVSYMGDNCQAHNCLNATEVKFTNAIVCVCVCVCVRAICDWEKYNNCRSPPPKQHPPPTGGAIPAQRRRGR